MKSILALLSVLVLCTANADEKPKNIIMVIGDGMGPAYTTAYRYFADDKSSANIEETVFDRHLVGMASTYPARMSGYVTDSAAGATALSTGFKSYNGAIAVDIDKKSLQTTLELARLKGMKTGVAVTSQINHATPASFAAHNESRRNYDQIADSYYDRKLNGMFVLDVMLGGGWDYFIRKDRNLVEQFQAAGYQYIDTLSALGDLQPNKPVIGLFGEQGMPWALDTNNRVRLPMLTGAAVKQLENDKGFFLVVEASQVDWAGHSNDVASAMAEMHDLAKTLEWLESYVEQHPDTLVVLTADHSTGGFTLAADGLYEWKPDPLKNLNASLTTLAAKMTTSDTPFEEAHKGLGFALTEEEKALIATASIGDQKAVYVQLKKVMDKRTNTGWTTSGHTGVDVQIFAMGAGSEHFSGHMDNVEIPQKIFALLGQQAD
ncbi:alkaline phosphatase [Aliiglaciecola sp. LCG003]|uniref:alkaline phosphatase n=1 Tax=Aliiglaciecola sp. LCG003 TaxID=3053655 RepID=UPI0025726FF4|nr:alkaline phosphatase [Aliiglaciecola sp. LCG003]WJG08448.1 alkaline phosphatase [Aliiglaciecola sp. LCG003]